MVGLPYITLSRSCDAANTVLEYRYKYNPLFQTFVDFLSVKRTLITLHIGRVWLEHVKSGSFLFCFIVVVFFSRRLNIKAHNLYLRVAFYFYMYTYELHDLYVKLTVTSIVTFKYVSLFGHFPSFYTSAICMQLY